MPAPILHRGLWPTVWPFSSHNCHTREILFPSDLLVYRSAIYPQGRTFKYGLGGRLLLSINFQKKEIIMSLNRHLFDNFPFVCVFEPA